MCDAVEVSETASLWFSKFLAKDELKLVRMPDSSVRETDNNYSPNGQTAFADGFPFLLTSKESLDSLNKKLENPVPMLNFRPNIVIEGGTEFEEDFWKEFTLSSLKMKVVKPCARCKVPTVNQTTGIMDPDNQPSKSMKAFRTGAAIGFKNEKWAVPNSFLFILLFAELSVMHINNS